MTKEEQLNIIEVLLFASPEPLTQTKLNAVFIADAPPLDKLISALIKKFEQQERPLQIRQVAEGYRITTKTVYETWIRRLINKTGQLSLSQAALEALAIIAYKQPVNRFEIEAVRGVDCTGVIKKLLDRNLIKIKGRDAGPGRPLLYATTNSFLEYFDLNHIADLPKLKEISELDRSDAESQLDAFIPETAPLVIQPTDSPTA